ncbi:SemiSWEET transporter [Acetobacteroides hydrogenigenes]|uniref:MtN3 and saliva related transmembrane protein n=1 Tax=Acetobacteroides hydrogenigenes TaxID=979970 RepID=A0A4R2ENL5_9BACT|nr:SemiSWEET transporter [Acetobacteroides hydrogenigenes]TCN70718.1 MtN3 and saliva related transmembrane protein [Acetobacteroides hydrogenigenes]
MEYIGYLAAFCTTFAFFPQAIMAIRTKDVKSISLTMYSILCFGISMWLVYGILKADWPLILANLITLLPSLTILYLKVASVVKKK